MTDMTINQAYSEIDRFFADKILPMRMLKAGVIAVIEALVAREHENGTRVADVGTAVVP